MLIISRPEDAENVLLHGGVMVQFGDYEDVCAMCDKLAMLLERYVQKVPLGYQPHMTALESDRALDQWRSMSENESKSDE